MLNWCSLCQYWSSRYVADGHGVVFRAVRVCECHLWPEVTEQSMHKLIYVLLGGYSASTFYCWLANSCSRSIQQWCGCHGKGPAVPQEWVLLPEPCQVLHCSSDSSEPLEAGMSCLHLPGSLPSFHTGILPLCCVRCRM